MDDRDSERLHLLLQVGRLLSSKLELGELLTSVLGLATRVVDAETASLLLFDAQAQELYFDVALGVAPEAAKVRLKLGQGIAGAVAQARKAEILNDVRADPRWSPTMDRASGFTTRSLLAVPILLKGRLIGVIEAINKRGGGFDEADRETFEAFAGQAAVALDNARLFASLREEKFKLMTVFSQMNDGAALTDSAGRVLLANGAAKRLLGEDLIDVTSGFSGLEVKPSVLDLLGDGAGSEFTAVRREPTLLAIAGRVTKAPLGDAQGRLFLFRDATESFRQEGLKRTFLSLISHKLKTPLAAVIGFSDLLLASLDPRTTDPAKMKAVKTIHQQGAKVGELVDKLIRYTTLESPDAAPRLEDVPVDEAVAEALKDLRERVDERAAKVDYVPSGAAVKADRKMFVEVVKNLVDNAVKFDPKPAPTVSIHVKTDGAWAQLSVADLGPGIPPEEHDKVFSRFHQVERDFTGQQEGMGLGLPYVKKVAELHGGSVRLSSKLGEGTTVTVTLPRAGIA